MTLRGYVFSKLETEKERRGYLNVWKVTFENTFDSQHVKESETLLKISRPHFHHTVLKLCQKVTWKMSVLVISLILQLFVNMLTAND